jgi:hypothetical protein
LIFNIDDTIRVISTYFYLILVVLNVIFRMLLHIKSLYVSPVVRKNDLYTN